jgi:hypothetical protein
MGQMLIPAAIGAGIGAVGGAAMGKNPLKTALLGAGIGAGGAGLFGGSAAAGAGAAEAGAGTGMFGATEVAGGGAGNLGMFTAGNIGSPGIGPLTTFGSAGEYASAVPNTWMGQKGMMDVSTGSVLGGQGVPAMAGGGYDPSMLGSIQRGAESGYNGLEGWLKNNPGPVLNTTGQLAISAMTPQPMPQPQMPAPAQIRPGSYNTAPTLGQGPNEKVASRIQLTPQQLQLYPSYFRGGY